MILIKGKKKKRFVCKLGSEQKGKGRLAIKLWTASFCVDGSAYNIVCGCVISAKTALFGGLYSPGKIANYWSRILFHYADRQSCMRIPRILWCTFSSHIYYFPPFFLFVLSQIILLNRMEWLHLVFILFFYTKSINYKMINHLGRELFNILLYRTLKFLKCASTDIVVDRCRANSSIKLKYLVLEDFISNNLI